MPMNKVWLTIESFETDYWYSSTSSQALYSTTCGEFASDSEEILLNFKKGMQASNGEDILSTLKHCLDINKAERFQAILNGDFYYKEVNSQINYSSDGYTHTNSYSHQQQWLVRPVIEHLIVHHTYSFYLLIKQIIEQNKATFIHTLYATLLADDKGLIEFNIDLADKIKAQLTSLKAYAVVLKQEQTENSLNKSRRLTNLAKGLEEMIDTKDLNQDASDPHIGLQNFKFKLELLMYLHKEDETFQRHRKWKRFVCNAITLLFSFGLLNGINYLITRRFLFFDKTNSQKKVTSAHHAIGLLPEENIQFKNTLPYILSKEIPKHISEQGNNSDCSNLVADLVTQFAL